MLLIRKDMPSKHLSIEKNSIEAFCVEINLRKTKWLLWWFYNPNKNNIHAHLENVNRNLVLYSSSYENQIIVRDFNVGPENIYLKSFCDNLDLTNIIKEPTCFKNPENLSCINLILLTSPEAFKILVLLRQIYLIFIRWHSL